MVVGATRVAIVILKGSKGGGDDFRKPAENRGVFYENFLATTAEVFMMYCARPPVTECGRLADMFVMPGGGRRGKPPLGGDKGAVLRLRNKGIGASCLTERGDYAADGLRKGGNRFLAIKQLRPENTKRWDRRPTDCGGR